MNPIFACMILALASAGATADDLPRIFITSGTGTGDLSSWPDANGLSGLQAADEVCRSRAAAAAISDADQYIALMSDNNDDAYCRVHDRSGKRYTNNCNSAALPVGAGPWYRMDGLAAMDIAENSMAYPTGYVPRHILYDEFGIPLVATPQEENLAFTGTWISGAAENPDQLCSDWTSASAQDEATLGGAFRGFGGVAAYGWSCDKMLRLICLEKGRHGPALPRPKPPTARMAFVTSAYGTGNLSSWPDAAGKASVVAADTICQTLASRASLPLAASYKAWISSSSVDAIDRFAFDGPLYRTDGVRLAGSISDLTTGLLEAPLQLDENGGTTYLDDVWTGTGVNGRSGGSTCVDWTSAGTDGGIFGQGWAADGYWTAFLIDPAAGCSNAELHLYCLGDNDSLFLDGFDG